MNNVPSSAILTIAAIAAVAGVIGLGFLFMRSRTNANIEAGRKVSNVNNTVENDQYEQYDGAVVKGSDVLAVLDYFQGSDVSIAVNDSSSGTMRQYNMDYNNTTGVSEALNRTSSDYKEVRDTSSSYYIAPDALFSGEVIRDQNGAIRQIIFNADGGKSASHNLPSSDVTNDKSGVYTVHYYLTDEKGNITGKASAGAGANVGDSVEVYDMMTANLTWRAPSGYMFAGWSIKAKPDAGVPDHGFEVSNLPVFYKFEKDNNDQTVQSGTDIKLYTVWKKQDAEVHFCLTPVNEGITWSSVTTSDKLSNNNLTISSNSFEYIHLGTNDEAYTIPSEKPKRPGYSFEGWSDIQNAALKLKTDGSGKPIDGQYLAGDNITLKSSVKTVLYPMWTRNYLAVTYEGNGGSTSEKYTINDQTVNKGSSEVTLRSSITNAYLEYNDTLKFAHADKDGKTVSFAGWTDVRHDSVTSFVPSSGSNSFFYVGSKDIAWERSGSDGKVHHYTCNSGIGLNQIYAGEDSGFYNEGDTIPDSVIFDNSPKDGNKKATVYALWTTSTPISISYDLGEHEIVWDGYDTELHNDNGHYIKTVQVFPDKDNPAVYKYTVPVTNPEKKDGALGYRFEGWTLVSEGKESTAAPGQVIVVKDGDILKARYTKAEKEYTINVYKQYLKYNSNGTVTTAYPGKPDLVYDSHTSSGQAWAILSLTNVYGYHLDTERTTEANKDKGTWKHVKSGYEEFRFICVDDNSKNTRDVYMALDTLKVQFIAGEGTRIRFGRVTPVNYENADSVIRMWEDTGYAKFDLVNNGTEYNPKLDPAYWSDNATVFGIKNDEYGNYIDGNVRAAGDGSDAEKDDVVYEATMYFGQAVGLYGQAQSGYDWDKWTTGGSNDTANTKIFVAGISPSRAETGSLSIEKDGHTVLSPTENLYIKAMAALHRYAIMYRNIDPQNPLDTTKSGFWAYWTTEDKVSHHFNTNTDTIQSFTIKDLPMELCRPERYGYTFTGWTEKDSAVPKVRYTVPVNTDTNTANHIYTAHWTPNRYRIVYCEAGYPSSDAYAASTDGKEILADVKAEEVGYEDNITLPSMAGKAPAGLNRRSYKFIGWSLTPVVGSGSDRFYYNGKEENKGEGIIVYQNKEIRVKDLVKSKDEMLIKKEDPRSIKSNALYTTNSKLDHLHAMIKEDALISMYGFNTIKNQTGFDTSYTKTDTKSAVSDRPDSWKRNKEDLYTIKLYAVWSADPEIVEPGWNDTDIASHTIASGSIKKDPYLVNHTTANTYDVIGVTIPIVNNKEVASLYNASGNFTKIGDIKDENSLTSYYLYNNIVEPERSDKNNTEKLFEGITISGSQSADDTVLGIAVTGYTFPEYQYSKDKIEALFK